MSDRLWVFNWHNVEGSWCFPSDPGSGTNGLRRQLGWLATFTHAVSLRDAVVALRSGRRLPRRATAITFDDGYADTVSLALPMLERLHLPATFFLTPELLTNREGPWWERLGWAVAHATTETFRWDGATFPARGPEATHSYEAVCDAVKELDERDRQAAVDAIIADLRPPVDGQPATPIMGWDGAEELVRRGFTVGSHSRRHVILARESPATIRQELVDSRRELEGRLAVSVDVLAYPNGRHQDFNEHAEQAAEEAGYIAAFTTVPGTNRPDTPRFRLHRYVMYPENGRVGLGKVPLEELRARLPRKGR